MFQLSMQKSQILAVSCVILWIHFLCWRVFLFWMTSFSVTRLHILILEFFMNNYSHDFLFEIEVFDCAVFRNGIEETK